MKRQVAGERLVRTEIGRSGRVNSVADAGSTIADAEATACVVKACYDLVFPEPMGGTVTVVHSRSNDPLSKRFPPPESP